METKRLTIIAILVVVCLALLAAYFSAAFSALTGRGGAELTIPSPIMILDVTPAVKKVLIEVGTNNRPDFAHIARASSDVLYIMVEPLTAQAALAAGCKHIEDRCTVVAGAVSNFNGFSSFRVGAASACSSLQPGGRGCAAKAAQIVVPTFTLDRILDEIPGDLPIELLVLDCQGTDFYAASSLRRHRHRVANIILECQDIPHRSKLSLYPSKKERNCGEVVSCITQHWGEGWVLHKLQENMYHVKEVNAIFVNTRHPLNSGASKRPIIVVHPYRNGTSHTVQHPAPCPLTEWEKTIA
jgi:FkbM family methyltransferase